MGERTCCVVAACLLGLAASVHAQEGLLLYGANSTGTGSFSVFPTRANGGISSPQNVSGLTGANNQRFAVRGDQAFAYVTANGSSEIHVIDTRTNTVVQTIGGGAPGDLHGPRDVAVSPDGRLVY